jgi:hypothetical protein
MRHRQLQRRTLGHCRRAHAKVSHLRGRSRLDGMRIFAQYFYIKRTNLFFSLQFIFLLSFNELCLILALSMISIFWALGADFRKEERK